MIRLTLFILLTLIILTNCSTNEPTKIKGIPEKVFWIGGKCGGQWYLIENIDKVTQTFNCKIYNDHTGELMIDKLFILDCYDTNKEINWDNLENEIRGVDWGFGNINETTISLKKRFKDK
jgi:hypothetical protein